MEKSCPACGDAVFVHRACSYTGRRNLDHVPELCFDCLEELSGGGFARYTDTRPWGRTFIHAVDAESEDDPGFENVIRLIEDSEEA
jgi:hypothetical protein